MVTFTSFSDADAEEKAARWAMPVKDRLAELERLRRLQYPNSNEGSAPRLQRLLEFVKQPWS